MRLRAPFFAVGLLPLPPVPLPHVSWYPASSSVYRWARRSVRRAAESVRRRLCFPAETGTRASIPSRKRTRGPAPRT